MIIPSYEQVYFSRTWTELYTAIGLNPRNDRACKPVQKYVRLTYPDAEISKKRRSGKISDADFSRFVNESHSTRQVIIRCGWSITGCSYTRVWRRIDKHKISAAHFLGQAHNRGKVSSKRRELSCYLTKDSYSIASHDLKLRLIKEGLKQHKCEICNGTEWLGKPIPITLDHINGDRNDNTFINLRILCPNCHAQTDTFGIRNRKNRKKE